MIAADGFAPLALSEYRERHEFLWRQRHVRPVVDDQALRQRAHLVGDGDALPCFFAGDGLGLGAHAAVSEEGLGKSASTGTPVSRLMAIAKGNEGVAFPALSLEIIDRSQPTFCAKAASVIPESERCFASVNINANVNVMNVNVKHYVNDITSTPSDADAKMCAWHR